MKIVLTLFDDEAEDQPLQGMNIFTGRDPYRLDYDVSNQIEHWVKNWGDEGTRIIIEFIKE